MIVASCMGHWHDVGHLLLDSLDLFCDDLKGEHMIREAHYKENMLTSSFRKLILSRVHNYCHNKSFLLSETDQTKWCRY